MRRTVALARRSDGIETLVSLTLVRLCDMTSLASAILMGLFTTAMHHVCIRRGADFCSEEAPSQQHEHSDMLKGDFRSSATC